MQPLIPYPISGALTREDTRPRPEPVGDSRVEAIAAAARDLVTARDAWLAGQGYPDLPLEKRTLTTLYNIRPDWFDEAHRQLDAAVFDAYGWPHDLSDEDILARLLALNLERAAAHGWGVRDESFRS